MGKKARKESKKKKGKLKSEVKDDIDVCQLGTEEISNYQLSASNQPIKGKFKTSRQRKRAGMQEQQLREEKSCGLKKGNKGLTQQGDGKNVGQAANENKAQTKANESVAGEARQPDSRVTADWVLHSYSENRYSNTNDIYDLRPSYFQNKDQKEPFDNVNCKKPQKSMPAKPSESSNSNTIFDLRPSYSMRTIPEESGINGSWRKSEYQSHSNKNSSWYLKSSKLNCISNNLWPSDHEEESCIEGNWRKVVKKSRKNAASNSPSNPKDRFDLNTINNRNPFDIQTILAKDIHKQLASGERDPNMRDLVNLFRAMAQACEAGKSESLNKILTAIQSSGFLRYQLPDILRKVQKETPVPIKEADKRQMIADLIFVSQTYLRAIPSAYFDLPLDEVQRYFRKLTVPNKAELQVQLDSLKKERDELIQDKRRRNAKFLKGNTYMKPPNSFRELQIFPTIQELTSDETTFLRANVKKGSYKDIEHYLDVQFRLYREDFIAPLREGIREIVQKIPKNERGQNIKTYDRVQIQEKKYTWNGIIYTLHFDASKFRRTRWESSNRLVYGSFLCLSKDNFANTLFATVANRDPKDLAKGLLDVCFVEGQNVYGIEKRDMDQYIMAESPAYFEAYRHVLAALQHMEEGYLPFQKYLLECRKDVDAPAYLRDKKEMVHYDLTEALSVPYVKNAKDVPPLQPEKWPDVSQLPLNDSQYEALRTALTKEFSVIQGPPGTGKTYVGLKIARCLLNNSHAWNPTQDSPILMVCFTNHALDQFLEGILDFLPKGIIRVGSRCKSERLEKFNLKNDVNIRFEERFDTRKRIERQLKRVKIKKTALKKYEDDGGIKKIHSIEDANCISKENLDSFYYSNVYDRECKTLQDVFEAWVCNRPNRRRKVDLNKLTLEFKANYKAPSQQEYVDALQCDEISRENSSLVAEDWGVADSDIDVAGLENFVDEDTDEESEDNSEDANSDFENAFEYCENATINDNELVQARGEANKKGICVISTQDVIVISDQKRVPETIDIDQEFEKQRHLHGEENLFQPICVTLDQNGNEEEQSEKPYLEEKETNGYQDSENIPCQEVTKKKKKKSNNKTSKATPSHIRRAKTKIVGLQKMKDEEIATISNIWNLNHEARLRLYLTWVDMLKEDFKRKIIQEEQAYDGLCREVETARNIEEEKILRKAKVIGMTTTGAARYHSMLQRIKPRIVIIEEAAEVLEAHIITSLARDTEQVILIGDHMQLRPKPTVHELAIKYNLEISLFERMVLNNMDCKMLSIQHRMRPEIAQLTKRIYKDKIYDDVAVTKFEDIRGMKTNLFFLDHREEESLVNGLQSYENIHEADMMVALCRYLLDQDYKPSQITILTMYIGQLLALKDKMPLDEFKGVRVTVVDNFQGEENDIILLSLVRSNTTGNIGFLKESNRICVALSRARKGLYCIGNFGLLSKDRLWRDICEDMKNKEALCDKLQLTCANHGEITEVKKVDDFKKVISGGCGRPCDLLLACGHRCPERCHGSDHDHREAKKCRKVCRTLCAEELHRCLERCHYPKECRPCLVLTTKVFPNCGHKGRTNCWVDPRTKNCVHIEHKTLQCGNTQDVPCFLDPLQSLQAQYNQTLKRLEKLQEVCCRQKKYSIDKEKDKVLNEYVMEMAYLKDRISKIRHNWPEYESALQCQETCRLVCSKGTHICNRKCHSGEECGPCTIKIKVELTVCGHKVLAPCYKDPDTVFCKEKCQRLNACGHKCQKKCGEDCKPFKCEMPCTRQCENNHPCNKACHWGRPCKKCKVPTEKVYPNCNHKIWVDCHADISTFRCFVPCERQRSCGHPCDKWCYEPCDFFPCKTRLLKTLPCGHQKVLPCYLEASKYTCTSLVKRTLPCGHELLMSCDLDPYQHLCIEEVVRQLPCGHKSKMKCHSDQTKRCCKEPVTKILSCGHQLEMPCYVDPSKRKCSTQVTRKLPCGHDIEMECHYDPLKHKCKAHVTRTLSCGHEQDMKCHSNPLKQKCTKMTMKALPCGHDLQVPCNADISKCICKALVKKTMPCSHRIEIPCSENVSLHTCKAEVMKEMRCGHQIQMPCNVDPHRVECTVSVDKALPCGHKVRVPCSKKDLTRFKCTEIVSKKMNCGHEIQVPCSKKVPKYNCEKLVIKKLPCGHENEMPCNCDPSRRICRATEHVKLRCGHTVTRPCSTSGQMRPTPVCCENVTRKLTCGHEQQMECYLDPSQYICLEQVEKKLSCGHNKLMPCHMDVSLAHCSERVMRRLQCGHGNQMSCNLKPENFQCLKRVKKVLKCGHSNEVSCTANLDDVLCNEIIKKTLPCKHARNMPCFKDVYSVMCEEIVTKELPCKHIKKVSCHSENITIQCYEKVLKTLPCKHQKRLPCYVSQEKTDVQCTIMVPKILPCSHEIKAPCHRDINTISCDEHTTKELPCGHEAEVPCHVDIKSISCDKPTMKQLPCGHEVETPCNSDTCNISCEKLTKKTLPCSHELKIQCNVDLKSVFCDQPKTKILPCGHEAMVPCNMDVNAISCAKLRKTTLPCNHVLEMPCNKDVYKMACIQPTMKQLACGHKVKIPCCKDISDISCDKSTIKKLPCGHEVDIPCCKDISANSCDKLTKKELPCGHEVEIPCNLDVNALSCYKPVMKQLSCTHGEVKLPCNVDVSTIVCQKSVLMQLPCGHMNELPCHIDINSVICDVQMTKKLSCGHTVELPCNKDQSDYECQRLCEKFLPCNHRCKQKCFESCDPNLCTEITTKTVPCPNKHKISVPCNAKVQDTYVCNQQITINLNCGHLWQGKCCESALPFRCKIKVIRTLACPGEHQLVLPCWVDVNEISCDKRCSKMLACGHPCKLFCEEPCNTDECTKPVLKTFKSCGHTKWLPCGISVKAICLYRCLRPLKDCGHPCQASCGKPCNKLCLYEVRKTLPCGHKIKMKCCDPVEYVKCPLPCTAKLLCGHICTGNCSTCQEKEEHSPCPFPCGRALVCSHRCHERCSDLCSPCFRECRGWCPHGRCQGTCSEACKSCTMPCANTCIHNKCNNLCHEMCDREPCNEVCQKMLACGHPCIGLCGESCPTLCYVCTPAKVAAISPNGQRNEYLRFIQLKECGHVIEVNFMDAWMQEPLNTETNGQAQPRRCPRCSVPIYFSIRYANTVREALQMMFEVECFTFPKRSRRRSNQTWTK